MADSKIDIIDFSDCNFSERHGTYGGNAGFKDGIVYNNENWILKYPKTTKNMKNIDGLSYTTTPLSEYIGSHIYQILGFNTQETLLGIKKDKVVVACKDFRADNEMLLEIRTIKNAANSQLAEQLERSFSETGDNHLINLDELLIHIKKNDILKDISGLEDFFWECVVVDIYINNNDRNNGNWGVIKKIGCPYKIAPVFDNGASFSNKISEEKLEKMLCSEEAIKNSALNTVTVFRRDNDSISPLMARDALCLDITALNKAIKRIVPIIINKQEDIKNMIKSIPEEYFGIPICSKSRGEFYIKSMECRLEHLLIPAIKKLI